MPRLPYMEGLEGAVGTLTRDQLSVLEAVPTHASGTPPALPSGVRFPVLLFSHGDQTTAFLYTSLLEDLASHGYVVVAVDHPGLALFVRYEDGSAVKYSEAGRPSPGGPAYADSLSRYLRRQLADRVSDLRLVREKLDDLDVAGSRLQDLKSDRVGAFGHSSGGLAATLLCQDSPVVDACVNIDGRLDASPLVTGPAIPPPSKPFMYVSKPFRTLTESELHAEGLTRDQATRTQADVAARDRRLIERAGPPSYRATFSQATHDAFSDEPLLLSAGDAKLKGLMAMVRAVIREFFDTSLRDPARLVVPRRDTEVEIEVLAVRPGSND